MTVMRAEGLHSAHCVFGGDSVRNQVAPESLLVPLPCLSAILHRAPVSECIFSKNKLERLRMTQFLQELQQHLLMEPSWWAERAEVVGLVGPAARAGGPSRESI